MGCSVSARLRMRSIVLLNSQLQRGYSRYKMARITAPELEQFIVATVELTGRMLGLWQCGGGGDTWSNSSCQKIAPTACQPGLSPQQVDLFLAPLLIFLVSID